MTIYRVDMTTYHTVADDVTTRLPGASSAPQTEYRPSAGHRVPPARVRAYRRHVEIDGDSGPAVARSVDERLRTAVDDHLAARERAIGIAVGSHCRAADNFSGYLGEQSDARLKGPQAALRHLFGVR
jgi:hypothetical protein